MFQLMTIWTEKDGKAVIFLPVSGGEMVPVSEYRAREILLTVRATPILLLPESYLASPVLARCLLKTAILGLLRYALSRFRVS